MTQTPTTPGTNGRGTTNYRRGAPGELTSIGAMKIPGGAAHTRVDDYLLRETRFGAYSVVFRRGNGLSEWVRRGLGLTEGDLYLEVHVPDSVTGSPRVVLRAFREGVVELADFLIQNGFAPKCLIGVTHQNVAKPAHRFLNFQVLAGIPEEAVDQEKAKRINQGYGQTKRAADGIPRGPLCLCYQSYESFMDFTESLRDRYGSQAGQT